MSRHWLLIPLGVDTDTDTDTHIHTHMHIPTHGPQQFQETRRGLQPHAPGLTRWTNIFKFGPKFLKILIRVGPIFLKNISPGPIFLQNFGPGPKFCRQTWHTYTKLV